MIGSTPQGQTCPDLLWQPRKAGKIWESWQLWPIVGGVGNGAAEEDWCWDLNPGLAAMGCLFRTMWLFATMCLGQRRTTTSISLSEIRYPRLGRGGRKDCAFMGILKDFGISVETLSHYS